MPSIIFGGLATRDRCLVSHPLNPPHLAPIVELCGADFTSPEVIERARDFMAGCAMSPITVKREIEGFILNRLQLAVLNEAFRLIAEGYVSAEDLDKTVKDGLALRWSFMGPIETIDLNAPRVLPTISSAMGRRSAAWATRRPRRSPGPTRSARRSMRSAAPWCRRTSLPRRRTGATGG